MFFIYCYFLLFIIYYLLFIRYASLTQKALAALGRNIGLVSVIDDFGDLIYREIDYRAEAVNAQRFAELYASIPDVFVPKIYTGLSTSKVSAGFIVTIILFDIIACLYFVTYYCSSLSR